MLIDKRANLLKSNNIMNMKTSKTKTIVFYSKALGIILLMFLVLTNTSCKSRISSSKNINSKSITVMSYNIHYGYGMDKKLDLPRIANIILREKADIVGLQEISDSIMANELGRLTNMNVVFGPSIDAKMNRYGDAILSKYPFEWVGNIQIPSASSSRYQAMAVDINLSEVYGESSIIRFINTHFDWLETIGSEEARLATIDVIERKFFDDKKIPAILTADLNAYPDGPILKKMGKYGWVNGNLGRTLLTSWLEDDVATQQIDYVLFRPKKRWLVDDVKVIEEPTASDHFPIIMKLKLIK